jgi:hypothetical protein
MTEKVKPMFGGLCNGGPWGGGCYTYPKPSFKLGPWVLGSRLIAGEYHYDYEKGLWVWQGAQKST